MKTAIILLSGAMLLMGCATGRSNRAATVRAQPVAARPAATPTATNYVTSSAMSSGYATAQPFLGGG